MDEISGIVIRGHRIASGLNDLPKTEPINDTIRKQKPFFKMAGIPGIADVFNGTINVDISPLVFTILRPNYEAECEWERGFNERFWFVETSLTHNTQDYRGYVYYPCPGPLKKHVTNNVLEVLAPPIEGLKYGDAIRLGYDSERLRIA